MSRRVNSIGGYPDRPLIVAAADDHALAVNAGRKGAERAAKAVGAGLLEPGLTAAEKAAGLTDFNDLHRARDLAGLKETLKAALEPMLARRDAPRLSTRKARAKQRRRAQAPARARGMTA